MSNIITMPRAQQRMIPTTHNALRAMLHRNGYILRRRGDDYLIVDFNNCAVHDTNPFLYALSLDDVRGWTEYLCD